MTRGKVGNTRMKDSPTEANHVSSEDTPVEMGQAPSEDIPEVYSTETDRAHDDDVPTEPGLTNDEDSPPELIEKNSQDDDLSSLPGISTLVPGYGSRLSAALHILPIAIEVSRAGIIGCNVLNLITSRFHDPLSTSAQGLTMADFSLIEKDFQQLKGLLNLVIDQISHL